MQTLAQTTTTQASGGGIAVLVVIYLAVIVVYVAGLWKVYAKAGKPGWAALIPIYNVIVLLQIAKRPIWWIILLFIPVVNLVILIIAYIDVAKEFGKTAGFGVGMALLGFIFIPILGFGNDTYQGGSGLPPAPPPPAPAF
jgi:hypothetical protein